MLKFGLVIVSLFLVFSDSGEGIKCYQCRSDVDKQCDSKTISPNYSVECPPNNNKKAVLCRKIHQKLRFKNEDDFTSIRECGYSQGHKKCYFFKFIKLALQETCECMQDNCNRGNSSEPVIVTFVISSFLSTFLMNIVQRQRVPM